MSIDFVLSQFNASVTLSENGNLETENISIPAHDAGAVFNVSLSDMLNVFKFETDSFNINDVDSTNLKYYVFLQNWPSNLRLNVANAMMDDINSSGALGLGSASISRNKYLLKHDYIRYLALRLFGTIQGVELFSNEKPLSENIASLSGDVGNGVFDQMWQSLYTISANDGTGLPTDANNFKYLTNSTKDETNIVRHLMLQIQQNQPERLSSVVDTTDPQSVPLMAGDIINFTVTLDAASGQEDLTGVVPIPTRTYLIRLVLQNSPSNTIPIDTAFISDFPYSDFSTERIQSGDANIVAEGSASPAALTTANNYMNGWAYSNTVSGGSSDYVEWDIPFAVGTTLGNLQVAYATFNVYSLTSIPFLVVKTASSTITYTAASGQITDVYKCQFRVELSVAHQDDYLIDGYQRVLLTQSSQTGSAASNEAVTSISIQSSASAATTGAVNFVATSVGVLSSSGNSVSYLVPV